MDGGDAGCATGLIYWRPLIYLTQNLLVDNGTELVFSLFPATSLAEYSVAEQQRKPSSVVSGSECGRLVEELEDSLNRRSRGSFI